MHSNLIVIFTIGITVASYLFSRWVFEKTKQPLLNPVLVSTVIIISVLLLLGLDFEAYKPGKDIMTWLLGPATVALALPLYRNRNYLKKGFVAVLTGVISGSLVNIIAVVLIARWAGLTESIVVSLAPKSVTAPIAIEVARIVGGDPALAAAFVVATGTLGATLGFPLLTLLGIKHPVARGLAIGTTSHGQGTAIALGEGETQGAMSGVAMALAAIFTSFAVPLLLQILLK